MANDICKIIKACKDSNVRSLEYGDLKLSFGDSKEETSRQEVIVAHKEEISDNIVDHLDKKEAVEQLVHDMEEMKIVDQLGYEKFLQEEDISHA